jgi:hypothetical protein
MAGSELVPRKDTPFWELSLIGQFRAVDREKARLFAQAVANAAEELGLHDVGWDIREMGEGVLTDEQAKWKLLEDTWRPEWGDPPWKRAVDVLREPFADDPTHEEVMERIRASRKELPDGEH